LEAFKQLLAPLSAASPFALVLLQHLDPTHASLLCAALSQTSKLPLAEARDGEQVEAGKVYVLPANATLSIRKGTLQLSPRRASRPHMPSMDFSGRSRRMWGLAQ
jgi:two-component system CheB/CheR fusion protein